MKDPVFFLRISGSFLTWVLQSVRAAMAHFSNSVDTSDSATELCFFYGSKTTLLTSLKQSRLDKRNTDLYLCCQNVDFRL